MKTTTFKQRLYTVLFCMLCLAPSMQSNAAIPIKQEQAKKESATQKAYHKIDELTEKYTSEATSENSDSNKSKSNDSGVFGILSLVFGILGIFPLAIIFGIIGMQKHRKYRELAIAGLVVGLVYAFLILLSVALIVLIWASI